MLKRLSTFFSAIRGLDYMQREFDRFAQELAKRRVTAQAGGGMVEAEVNGSMEVLRVTLAPELVAKGDGEMIEELVVSAVNQGLKKAKAAAQEAMRQFAAEADPGGLAEMMGEFEKELEEQAGE